MSERLTRRNALGWGALTVAVSLAGCSGSSDSPAGDSNGASDSGDDSGSSGSSDGESGDGSNGGEDDDATDGESGATDSSDDTPLDLDPASVELGSLLQWNSSYVAEIDIEGEQSPEMVQTVHEGDVHLVVELGTGEVLESYRVDGETYSIVEGQCLREEDPAAEDQAPEVEEPSGTTTDEVATERTEIDGEPVYVFEPDQGNGASVRWYVSATSGYPVRFESADTVTDFHSWGATEPIEPPEGPCIDG